MARSRSNGTMSCLMSILNILTFSNVILGSSVPPSEVQPAIPIKIHISIAVIFMAVYTILFFFIFWQLVLILHFGHRRVSYQTFFLFTCLLWAGVRTTLFSFYFQDCTTVNHLLAFPRWFLFALPIYLQFLMLTLLTLYLVKLVVKSGRTSIEPARSKRIPNVTFMIANILFLVINVISCVLCPDQRNVHTLVILRVVVNESLFIFAGILVCLSMRKIIKTPNSNLFLEGQGTTSCQITGICLVVVLLYISRAVYNMVAVTVPHDIDTFGFGWINISDEGEIKLHDGIQNNVKQLTFLSFGVILILWEVLPTFMIIWFFRVRRPPSSKMLQGPSVIANSNSYDQRSYFFDNPRRYDSDEDINSSTVHNKSNYDIPGVLSPPSKRTHCINTTQSYGSITGLKNGSFNRSSSSSYPIPGTTPPALLTGQQNGYQRTHLETVKDQD